MGDTGGRPVLPVLIVGDGADASAVHAELAAEGYLVGRAMPGTVGDALTSRVWSAVVTGWLRDDVDAVAVCKEVRATPSAAPVPIVVLTSGADDELADDVRAAGADDVVGAPCDGRDLVTRVRAASRPLGSVAQAAQLTALMANLPGIVYRCEPDELWTMWYLSDRVADLTGYPASDFVANSTRSFVSIIHPDDRGRVQSTVAAAVHRDQPFEVGYRIVTADSAVRHVVDRGRLAHENQAAWLDGIILDVTDRYLAEEHLRDQLVRQAASDERLRIAHDLHDSVSQTLYSMVAHARAAELTRADTSESELRADITRIRFMAQEALDNVRETVVSLRPSPAEHDLAAAVRRHAAEITARGGTEVVVTVADALPSLDPALVSALTLVAREAVHNAAKHAAPASVHVDIRADSDGTVAVDIRDDGSGFDPSRAVPDRFGLATMRERTERLGGRLDITSRPGEGTNVRATVPVQPPIPESDHGR